MENKMIIDNLNKWKEGKSVQNISLNKITIQHPVHLRTDCLHFNGRLGDLSYNNGKISPLVLQRVSKNRYILLFGLKQLTIGKLSNLRKLPAIVVKYDRDVLVGYLKAKEVENETSLQEMKLSDIIVPRAFAESTPSSKKVNKRKEQFMSGEIDIIKIDSESREIVDGYITYLTLKGLKVDEVKVELV